MRNKSGRDAARSEFAEIAALLKGDVATFKAAANSPAAYNEGGKILASANAAFKKGDFGLAKSLFGEAKGKIVDAIRDAKTVCIRNALVSAKKFFDEGKLDDCIAECDTVLAMDSGNEEAISLRNDTISLIVPSATFIAKVDNRKVQGAKVKFGGREYVLPFTKGLNAGSSIGPFRVQYSEDGKCYEGTFKAVTVNWRGPRTLSFPLKKYVEPKHGDRKTLVLPGGATMEMIYCAMGEYAYGDDNASLTMDHGFWMGKYEVTQAQWKSVMKDSPSRWKGDDLPVDGVSWNECQEFVEKVNAQLDCGARLPTEHEWEYACRAGTATTYSWGNALNGDKANCDGSYPSGTSVKGRYLAQTTTVGKYGANPWGFCDMHGNVWEWCQDSYDVSSDRRVLRGGSWGSHAWKCRSACRFWLTPGYRDSFYGFRLCCSEGPRD